MKKKSRKKITGMMISILILATVLTGCTSLSTRGQTDYQAQEEELSDNIILTETGEVLEKEETPSPEATPSPETAGGTDSVAPVPLVELSEPVQEQVITEEDQVDPKGSELQLVFLGDSIFDNNRDGTGVPFLTAEQCEADVYNLAIGGTSASIEWDESQEYGKWTSKSLCGIVNAMMKVITTAPFEGTRTKELLDNPNIDFSQTDYFIVEYGMNDFFRAVPQSNPDNIYDQRTYSGALLYAVSNLTGIAPDATIILCSPTYARFFNGDGWMIGDGNSLNTGNGTLFDYKGTCNYVANECNAIFFNAYEDLGINGYTADQYLEDGVHLTAEGRQLYADALAKIILSYEETKNN